MVHMGERGRVRVRDKVKEVGETERQRVSDGKGRLGEGRAAGGQGETELGRLCSGRWEGLAQSARLWREVWGEVLPRQNPLHRGRHFGAERGQVSILQGNVCG